ncbi:hypothetical protein D1815_08845 [Aquimarina sp. AD1]|uniref:hypothetical protein n=1 Tax=Aquimarina TaxID=290174 RepID=UPI0003F625BF|nr:MULTISPECIES: hypothetical protein [Aquimarina]AXT55852.1 hypothetical protein D1815_08845 [Aquimarina sp. AD1]RKN15148.1 hypothetical protein D7035_16425 [Aquimarina sp. AD1]
MYDLVVTTQIIINVFEILGAVIGIFYLTKYRDDQLSRYFVYYLWFTVSVELVFGWLPASIFYLDFFSFLRGTLFEDNIWIYNIYQVISYGFYLFYFSSLIEDKKNARYAGFLFIIYLFLAILNLIFSGIFFEAISSFTDILGTLLLLFSVIYFYFQLLKSDKILNFYKNIPFYVSIGALVFHLVVNPIFIYDTYYSNSKSEEFVEIQRIILTLANIFMYTCYILGFIVCSKKNKSYY